MFDFDTPVDRIGTHCTQWDYVADRFGQSNLLPFTISDMDFETAPCVRKVLTERLGHGVFGYSRWNHDEFKTAVSLWFLRRFNAQLDSDHLAYGPSVIYIISQLITLWSEPGDGVLVHTPAYDAFTNMLTANNRELFGSALKKEQGEFQIDWLSFEEQIARPNCRILLLCNPHNPTGRVWRKDELDRMAQLCDRYGIYVISDDIHMDMSFKPYTPWSEVACNHDWALVSSGSKAFNIPALQGAYAFIPENEHRENYLERLKAAHGLSSPSIFGVLAHISVYQEGDVWLDGLKTYLYSNLCRVAERVNEAFPQLDYKIPEGTYLAWIDLRPLNIEMEALQQRLIEHYQVAIMRGDTYGAEGKGFVRLNIGCPRSKVDKGLDALLAALQDLYCK